MNGNLPYGWLSGEGPAGAMVLSCRVRAARNLAHFPFPLRAQESSRREILSLVFGAAKQDPGFEKFDFVDLEKLPALDRQLLVENHMASPMLVADARGRGLLVQKDFTVSVMINEEDHLRLQCFLSGLDLEKGWSILNRLDDALENRLPYACHEHWGYLAACPTNLGTGLRASVLLHLPALTFLQAMPALIQSLNQTGIVVRGFYGEGTESQGHFYQLSNAFSLGPTEEDIVGRVSSVARQVLEQETQARNRLKHEEGIALEDRVFRSLSILKSARIMSSSEAMEHLSFARLGVHLGILPPIPVKLLNELLLMTRPANIQKNLGQEPDPGKRDALRADYLRNSLAKW